MPDDRLQGISDSFNSRNSFLNNAVGGAVTAIKKLIADLQNRAQNARDERERAQISQQIAEANLRLAQEEGRLARGTTGRSELATGSADAMREFRMGFTNGQPQPVTQAQATPAGQPPARQTAQPATQGTMANTIYPSQQSTAAEPRQGATSDNALEDLYNRWNRASESQKGQFNPLQAFTAEERDRLWTELHRRYNTTADKGILDQVRAWINGFQNSGGL